MPQVLKFSETYLHLPHHIIYMDSGKDLSHELMESLNGCKYYMIFILKTGCI